MRVITLSTPNQSDRNFGSSPVRIIVCHTPEGSYSSTVDWIMNPDSEVSYHLLINKEGTEATQFVPYTKKAWHALSYNSLSDGISVADYARLFDLSQQGVHEMAKVVASRLVVRGVPCQWTTDPIKGGFCRHADLQTNRSDPTPDIPEWQLFCAMVDVEYQALTNTDKPWPIPVPQWFWTWARWRLGVSEFKQYGPANAAHRPGSPVPSPGVSWAPGGKNYWAWARLNALVKAQRK